MAQYIIWLFLLFSLVLFFTYAFLILVRSNKIIRVLNITFFVFGFLLQIVLFKIAIEDDQIVESADTFSNPTVNLLLIISYFSLVLGLLLNLILRKFKK